MSNFLICDYSIINIYCISNKINGLSINSLCINIRCIQIQTSNSLIINNLNFSIYIFTNDT